jgi:hypothetical protein
MPKFQLEDKFVSIPILIQNQKITNPTNKPLRTVLFEVDFVFILLELRQKNEYAKT